MARFGKSFTKWLIQAGIGSALPVRLTWVQDQYFPTSYAHAWRRLLPFFQRPGIITRDAATIQVELTPFNDRALNRDLALVCERVNQASPHLPDGRVLSFTLRSARCILPAQKEAKIT